MKTKICSKCKIVKDTKEFSKSKKEKDGLQYHCKKCQNKYRKENREKYKKYYKEYRAKRRSKKLTSKEKLFEIIKDKNSISLKELKECFDNKKELFTDIESLIDDRIIGCSVMIGGGDAGESYYVKK